MCEQIPLHVCTLQIISSVSFPLHFLLSVLSTGLVQLLNRLCLPPPQLTVHGDHPCHALHFAASDDVNTLVELVSMCCIVMLFIRSRNYYP